MGHEVHNRAELVGRTRRATVSEGSGKSPWRRGTGRKPLPIRFPHFSWLKERGGKERGEGSRDLDKGTEVRMITTWL